MAFERRDRGSGSIRKRNDDLWEGRYKGKVCYGKNKTEAGRNLKELIKQTDESLALRMQPTDYSFGEWIDKWLTDYKQMSVKETTYSSYTQNIRVHIKPAIGDIKLSSLTADDIQMLLRKMSKNGAMPATVIKVKNIISGSLEQAVKNRYIPFNPVKATSAPKLESKEVRVFTREEQALFVDTIKGHRLQALFLTALGTGMRRGELIALTWENVDFAAREISVAGSVSRVSDGSKSSLKLTSTKSKRSRRIIPINRELVNILTDHLNRQEQERKVAGSAWNDADLVFCSSVGSYIEPRRLGNHLDKILEVAKIDHINFHALRHTFATRFLEQGGSLKALQEILGHADGSLTINTYSHVLGSTIHSEMEKTIGILSGSQDQGSLESKDNNNDKPQIRTLFQPHNKRGKGTDTKDGAQKT